MLFKGDFLDHVGSLFDAPFGRCDNIGFAVRSASPKTPPQDFVSVGWAERSETHRRRLMGFAKAQPILLLLHLPKPLRSDEYQGY
jgi:hypothetical protein